MLVYFFRHGERGTGGTDPSLSSFGHKQAEQLVTLVKNSQKTDLLLCSPKKRTFETLSPLAREIESRLDSWPELDERKEGEPAKAFNMRVKNCVDKIASLQRNVIVCSHMDWLQEAMIVIPDDGVLSTSSFHWPTAGYVVFEIEDGVWKYLFHGQVPAC